MEDDDLKDNTFEVIYVSSDTTENMCYEYMNEKHGNWLRIKYNSLTRSKLKLNYGVFAGSESGEYPGITRRSGIPTIVVVDKNGNELDLLDCDDPKIVKEIETKGIEFLKRWPDTYKW